MDVQEIGLGAHDRIGPASPADPGNGGIGVVGSILPGGAAEVGFKVDVIRVIHILHQEVRGRQAFAGGDVHDVVCHGDKFRDPVTDAHVQILEVVVGGEYLPILVPTGGIGGEDGIVRLPVGQHHPQVPQHVLLIGRIAQILGQHEHGVVVHQIVVAGGLFGVLAVLIAVHALIQIDVSSLDQIRLVKHPAAAGKQRGNGPAVVGGVEAALQQTPAACVDNPGHPLLQPGFARGQLRLCHQVFQMGDPGKDAEGGIRGGEEVAGHKVKQTVLMLHPLHIVDALFCPGQNRLVVIIPAVGVAVGRHIRCHGVHGGLRLKHAVSLNHRAVIGTAFVHHLSGHGQNDLILNSPNHLFIMCSHLYCSLFF